MALCAGRFQMRRSAASPPSFYGARSAPWQRIPRRPKNHCRVQRPGACPQSRAIPKAGGPASRSLGNPETVPETRCQQAGLPARNRILAPLRNVAERATRQWVAWQDRLSLPAHSRGAGAAARGKPSCRCVTAPSRHGVHPGHPSSPHHRVRTLYQPARGSTPATRPVTGRPSHRGARHGGGWAICSFVCMAAIYPGHRQESSAPCSNATKPAQKMVSARKGASFLGSVEPPRVVHRGAETKSF